jgi:UDP-N-acetylmuramoyl-L-alanyl-D-glutamate--2,6-diaminopimelate ligase
LDELLKGISDARIVGDKEIDVKAIRYDSRRVQPGDMFAAIRGEHYNGTSFVKSAEESGATSLLLAEGEQVTTDIPCVFVPEVRRALARVSRNFFSDPSSRMKVIGITGTNGKTTTSYITHGILEASGVKAGLIGTVQYLVGSEIIRASRTTPESPDLLALLDNMISADCGVCIMEVSSHALTLHRVDDVVMEVAVFMNLTRDHLDFHRDMEDYFSAKGQLFLEQDVRNRVINIDDPFGIRLIEKCGDNVVTFGMGNGDVRPAGKVETGDWGSRCTLSTPWGEVDVNTALPGRFNISNIMAGVSICGLLGLTAQEISEGLAAVKNVPGRFEKVDRGQSFTAIVDYAHTPDALENLLSNIKEITQGRVLAVFGCGGDRDRAKRPMMGQVAGSLADVVYVTSDNPRSEEPESIIDDIMTGLDGSEIPVNRIMNRRDAICRAVSEAQDGDTVVVAGKGHENYQITGKKTLPFSDVDELAVAIKRALEGTL